MAELTLKLFVRSRWSAVKRPVCVWAENVDVVVDKVLPRLSTIGILNR